jgi:hypothetical protein
MFQACEKSIAVSCVSRYFIHYPKTPLAKKILQKQKTSIAEGPY